MAQSIRSSLGNRFPFLLPLYARVLYSYRAVRYANSTIGQTSRRNLLAYKNKHAGERCFIIGNGPSLKKMDLAPLKNEVTFGLNRIYLLFSEIGFATSYFVTVNPNVVEQFFDEIAQLPMPKFIGWQHIPGLTFTDSMSMLPPSPPGLAFSDDITRNVWPGYTVTYLAMQIAYYMGFQTVILIGVDHNFTTQGPANQLVVSQGEDPNHFHPNYFGKGIKWQLPDLEGSERAYRLAKDVYSADGRTILDATVGGKLTIFPKVDFTSLFP